MVKFPINSTSVHSEIAYCRKELRLFMRECFGRFRDDLCEKLKNNSRSKRLTFETKNCWVGHCEIGPTEPVPLAGYGGIDAHFEYRPKIVGGKLDSFQYQ